MNSLSIHTDVERDGFDATAPARGMKGAEREAWLEENVVHLGNGVPIEIGGLRAGTDKGNPSVAFCFPLPDGRVVIAETTLALLQTATMTLCAALGNEPPRRDERLVLP